MDGVHVQKMNDMSRTENPDGPAAEHWATEWARSVTELAVFAITPDGIISTWNAGAEVIYGYRPDEIIGAHSTVLLPDDPKEREAFEAELRQAREKVAPRSRAGVNERTDRCCGRAS